MISLDKSINRDPGGERQRKIYFIFMNQIQRNNYSNLDSDTMNVFSTPGGQISNWE